MKTAQEAKGMVQTMETMEMAKAKVKNSGGNDKHG